MEYPDAKKKLMDKGRHILRKDSLLDEGADMTDSCETPEEKISRLEELIDRNQTRLARLIASFNVINQKLSTRLAKLEKELELMTFKNRKNEHI